MDTNLSTTTKVAMAKEKSTSEVLRRLAREAVAAEQMNESEADVAKAWLNVEVAASRYALALHGAANAIEADARRMAPLACTCGNPHGLMGWTHTTACPAAKWCAICRDRHGLLWHGRTPA